MAAFVFSGRVLFFTVFALSAAFKLRDFDTFRRHVAATVTGPGHRASAAAGSAVAAEVAATCSMLLPGPLVRGGFLWIAALMGVFTVYLVLLLRRGRDTSCGCMGDSDQPASWFHVARNAVLLLGAAGLLAASSSDRGVGSVARPELLLAGTLPALALTVLVVWFDDVLLFFRGPLSEAKR